MSTYFRHFSLVCVVMLFLASCTSFEPGFEGVNIRVLNNSDFLMEDVTIGGIFFGDVRKNELTDFVQVEQIYGTTNVHLLFADHSFEYTPIDHVGERPIQTGSFTFIISAEDEYGAVFISMVEGDPPAGDAQPQNAEQVIETVESYSAVSAIELQNGAILIAGNKETARFINPTISSVPGSRVRYFQNALSFIKSNEEWLIKIDAHGNLIWSKPLTAGLDSGPSKKLYASSDGGFIMAGSTTYFPSPDAQDPKVHLVKADADGYTSWAKTFDSGIFTVVSDLKPARDGGFIISGAHDGFAWLLKVTDTGAEEWRQTLRNSFYAESALAIDNGYVVAGGRYGDNRSSPGGVAKTDLMGKEAWSVKYEAELWAVSEISDGAVFVSGTADRKAIAIKLDASGAEEWMKEYPAINKGGTHVVVADSHFVVAGQIDRSPAVFYVNTEGELVWSRKFPAYPLWKPNTEDILVSTADGNVVFIGNSIDNSGEGIYVAKVDLNGNILFDTSL